MVKISRNSMVLRRIQLCRTIVRVDNRARGAVLSRNWCKVVILLARASRIVEFQSKPELTATIPPCSAMLSSFTATENVVPRVRCSSQTLEGSMWNKTCAREPELGVHARILGEWKKESGLPRQQGVDITLEKKRASGT